MTTVSVSNTLLTELGDDVWVSPVAVRQLGWRRVYHAGLVASDLAAGLLGASVVDLVAPAPTLMGRALFTVTLAFGWLVACRVARTHEIRSLPSMSDEVRRVLRVAAVVTAVAAFVVLAAGLTGLRAAIVVGLPAAGAASASARVVGQRLLRAARRRGRCFNRVVVVGGEEEVLDLVGRMRRDARMGLEPVAACVPGGGNRLSLVRLQVPVMGDVWDAASTAQRQRAAAIVVGGGP